MNSSGGVQKRVYLSEEDYNQVISLTKRFYSHGFQRYFDYSMWLTFMSLQGFVEYYPLFIQQHLNQRKLKNKCIAIRIYNDHEKMLSTITAILSSLNIANITKSIVITAILLYPQYFMERYTNLIDYFGSIKS